MTKAIISGASPCHGVAPPERWRASCQPLLHRQRQCDQQRRTPPQSTMHIYEVLRCVALRCCAGPATGRAGQASRRGGRVCARSTVHTTLRFHHPRPTISMHCVVCMCHHLQPPGSGGIGRLAVALVMSTIRHLVGAVLCCVRTHGIGGWLYLSRDQRRAAQAGDHDSPQML